MTTVLVSLAVSVVCLLSQVVFLRRIRQTLVANHPAYWLKMSAQAWFIDRAVFRFAFGGRDKRLGDPALTRRILQFRLLHAGAILAWLTALGVVIASAATRHA